MVSKPAKIALAMITLGEEKERLERLLESVAEYVDGIFVTITTPGEEAAKIVKKFGGKSFYKPHVFHREVKKKEVDWFKKTLGWEPEMKIGDKIIQFDQARNFSFEQVPEEYDWIMWLDTDDILRGGKHIKAAVEAMEANNVDAMFMNYLYRVEVDDTGQISNILIQHLRERIVRRGVHKWVAPIHETLIAQRPSRHMDTKDMDVIHLANFDQENENLRTLRNKRTLELSIFDTKGRDPRPVYYLGKTHFDIGKFHYLFERDDKQQAFDFECSLKLFNMYLNGSDDHNYSNKSGWAEERAQCYEYMSEIFKFKGELNNAVKCCMNAMIETPQFPSTYLSLAHTYIMRQEWSKARHWLKIALNLPMPNSTLVSNPKEMESRAHEIVYHAGINENKIDEALNASKALMELHPENPDMVGRFNQANQIKASIELTKMFTRLAQHLETTGEFNKVVPLIQAAPHLIENNPFVAGLKKKILPPKKWAEDEIAIYCGPGFTNWSPKELEKPEGSFMGGSEEAVVYLSKELAQLGWKVTVYADPGEEEGMHDGVEYLPHYKFNKNDTFNIIVAWRQPLFVDGNYDAKKTYVWCHDIQNQLDYTPERLEKIEKVIVLSPWHRTNIPNVPDDKILISANGMTL